MGTPLDAKEWRQTKYRAQLWDWGPALCRAKRWKLLFPGVGTMCQGRWCWLAVSGIADCFKECISQSDRCKRIRRVKCHRETGMTQLTGRTEDVQLRRAEASTCWCWQESGGRRARRRGETPGGNSGGGVATNKSSLSCSSSAGWEAAFWTGLLPVHDGVTGQGTHGSPGWCQGSLGAQC